MHPKTDIVCLVHNNLPVTEEFTHHLFENTSNFRLIFIDNASSDGTPDFLRKGQADDKWDVITSPVNLGVIKGRNLGAKYTSSEYFLNIDNDQYVGEGWLEGLYELINQGYDIVGPEAWQLLPPKSSGAVVVNGNLSQDRSYFPFKHCERPKDKFTYIGCGGMLIKREVYNNIGLFDEQFGPAYFEDPDFGFRAIKAGYKLGWKYNSPVLHLGHQTFHYQKLFNRNAQFTRSLNRFRKKWFPYFPKPIQMP